MGVHYLSWLRISGCLWPLEALGEFAFITPNLILTLIAETMDPAPNAPTHTFQITLPLCVLIVSGGISSRGPPPTMNAMIAVVKECYPTI